MIRWLFTTEKLEELKDKLGFCQCGRLVGFQFTVPAATKVKEVPGANVRLCGRCTADFVLLTLKNEGVSLEEIRDAFVALNADAAPPNTNVQ